MRNLLPIISTFIGGWLIFSLCLALYTQSRDFYGSNPILRPRLEVKEPFQVQVPDGVVTTNLQDAGLADPRKPYALLPLPTTDTPPVLSAQRCHEADFATRLEKTGNYRQLTNNYRHADPDSCTGWTEELNLAIYKAEPLKL